MSSTPTDIHKTIEGIAEKAVDNLRLAVPFKSSIDSAYAGGDPNTKRPGESAAGSNTKRSLVCDGWEIYGPSDDIVEQPVGADTVVSGVISTRPAGNGKSGAYFLLPGFRVPESTGTYVSSGANVVKVQKVFWPGPLLVASVHVEVVTTSAGILASVGIYSADGLNLLINSGTFACDSGGIKSNTLGAAVKLPPRWYWYAFTATDTVATLRAATSGANIQTVLNGGTIQRGQAANAATAGVLPATLGTISDVSYTNTPLAKMQS